MISKLNKHQVSKIEPCSCGTIFELRIITDYDPGQDVAYHVECGHCGYHLGANECEVYIYASHPQAIDAWNEDRRESLSPNSITA